MTRLYLSVLLLPLLAASLAAQPSAIEKAWALLAKDQRPQAIALLRDLVKTEPRNAEARLMLGSILMEDGDRAGAIAQLTEAVHLRPKSAEAHNALGEAYRAFDDLKAARPEFTRAVELDPRHAQAHANLGALLLQQDESKSAAIHLDHAIRLFGKKPDAAHPLYLRAKIYSVAGDSEKAAAALEQAVVLRPDFPEAWSDLGEARKTLADDERALAAFRRAVELDPANPVAQTRLGLKLLDSGNAHDAVRNLEEAVRLDPKNQSALNALQRALRQDGQAGRANEVKRQLADVIRGRDKSDQNLVAGLELNNRGVQLEKGGDISGAVVKYRGALELCPDHNGIRTNLAVALLKLGQWDEGLTLMREAVRRDPANKDLRDALDDAVAQYQRGTRVKP